ncbi:MAG: hypothetical protein ACI94Y_003701 [Maribacter sp.]|jgi:hypothetical protein
MIFSHQYMKPSFLIIGGVKCGTSSLYRYLNKHPAVLPCKTKEPGFLCSKNPLKLIKGMKDYQALFPLKNQEGEIEADWLDLDDKGFINPSKIIKEIDSNTQYITGEATARTYYCANPYLVKMLFPQIKVIMLVRNPTDRMYSHFQMYLRLSKQGKRTLEKTNFNEFIEHQFYKFQHNKSNILTQGRYTLYLKKWNRIFGKKNMLIFHTNDFSKVNIAQKKMEEICQLLNLPHYDFSTALNKKHNKSTYNPIDAIIQKKLDDFYLPYNQEFKIQYGIQL